MDTSEGDVFIGIDVSKRRLDAHRLPDRRSESVAYDADGLARLIAWLHQRHPTLIVLEATGGLQLRAAADLTAAGFAVAVVNPRQVRDFARATGQLAKTDRLDAEAIAQFAAAIRPHPRPLPDAQRQHLIDLVGRRRQLIDMRVAEKLRRSSLAAPLRPRLDDHLAWLAQAIVELDQQIDTAVRTSELWRHDETLLTSVPGVGRHTAAALIAELPELGRIPAPKLASLVGLAPFNNDSGTLRGRRSIRGGRASVRTALYMATITAIRCNAPIKVFHQRLRDAGKPAKVAITACMHKLLLVLNAIMRSQTKWRVA